MTTRARYYLEIEPEHPSVGDPVEVRLFGEGDASLPANLSWMLVHGKTSLGRIRALGESVRVTFHRPGAKLLRARLVTAEPTVVAEVRCQVEENLWNEVGLFLGEPRERWFTDMVNRHRRTDLDGALSARLRLGPPGSPAQKEAFARLVLLAETPVRRILQAMRLDEDAVQEALQQAATNALANLSRFLADPEERPFGPWYAQIARHAALDRIRRSGRQARSGVDLESRPAPAHHDGVEFGDLLNRLTPLRRKIVRAYVDEKRTFKEIAQDLGWALTRTFQEYQRALSDLRQWLDGGDPVS